MSPVLSLGGEGWGFPQATNCMNVHVAPGFFHRKIEEKWNEKKSLAALFPTYLSYLPGNLKSYSDIPVLLSIFYHFLIVFQCSKHNLFQSCLFGDF